MRGHFQAIHLSKIWPITLATEAGVFRVENGVFTECIAAPARELPNGRALLRSLFTRKHYLFEKYNGRNWAVPDVGEFTHIIVHYPALLEFVRGKRGLTADVIFDTHNNEREYFESVAARTAGFAKPIFIRRQASISERIIKQAAANIDATVSVSESDREWVAGLCSSQTRHFVVPNNLFRYEPTTWTGRKSVLYVGSLNVNMNLQALEWFTTRVWPALKESAPEVDFIVAGRNPAVGLVSDLERKGIQVVANAPSLTGLYADAMFSVIPAASGSGGKIKVGEALAHGVPVLTTAQGLVGQPAAIRECCIVNDDPGEWVSIIREHLGREERSSKLWDAKVENALTETYFGSSIMQIAGFIGA
ncbi:glycosyltransferase involved in cell wall biosynthesis [Mycolicibacterium iranicum]|uniref:Glycosyltransferase involved in cell wall biosynthesis n=1 Tax=Mycolicibacterium iranicum TaxID=912594 RepID=A0A839Q4U6_MYCIR|nr:glycosyltransferase [Mycolicibacterium iranicum]MBB2991278.1 glycosyltransferase involved in cell wall biosynthesis [Mycolicibacterium iranicum]